MKKIFKILISLSLLVSTFSCGEEGSEVIGRIKAFEHLGFKCWVLEDLQNNHYYELVSNDELLLQEGKKVRIRIKEANDSKTICNVGDKVKVLSYRFLQ
ncbi:MAG: hypothetical protein U0457_18215 [Candidatus Sericytochromatia bacterium]